ncbi:hypothetical protein J1N35_044726 [Gossypium stocksii]|uniref:Uncharacterized protein n=1 Tax=Gossypium stocksii TaxID=47602 RepID=A0A9D3U9R7_9ROSI|nr:hypothetical protein J1N35_044726 [Gossypium stocksii]
MDPSSIPVATQKQQVLFTVHGNGPKGFLDGTEIVPPLVVMSTIGEAVVNPDFCNYKKQDCALASWLLSTISPHILPKLVGAKTSHSVRSTLLRFFPPIQPPKSCISIFNYVT